MNKSYPISLFYFKQTIILFLVSFFLFTLTSVYHLGVIGVIVFIRALFMFRTEYIGYKSYSIIKNENGYFITRGKEEIFIPAEDIIDETFKITSFFSYYTLVVKTKQKGFSSVFVFPYVVV